MIEPKPTGNPQVTEHDRESRLRPHKPRGGRENAFRVITKLADKIRNAFTAKPVYQPNAYDQRCIVKMRYASNRKPDGSMNPGRFASHGNYIERTVATLMPKEKSGFNYDEGMLPIKSTLDRWQQEGDARIFKIMISPESPGIDLHKLTRDTMQQIQKDIGRNVEWVAAMHRNTDQPHVHIAMRGRDTNGIQYKLAKDYVKGGIRRVAIQNCNAQLGYRIGRQPRIERTIGVQIQRQIGVRA